MDQGNPGCLSLYFGSSWRKADAIFAPRECFLGEEDEEMVRLYKRRSAIGTFIILCIAIRYHHFNGISDTFGAVYQGINWTVEFATLSVIPAGAAVVLYTKSKKRRSALVQMRYPAIALGAWLLIISALPFILKLTDNIPHNVGLALLLIITALIAQVWFASFMLRAVYLMATGLFRLRDGHPLLPPIVTVLAAWALAIRGLVEGASDGGEPAALAIILLIGGPISLTTLAALEIERLKRNYPDDFPFRNGPLRSELSARARLTLAAERAQINVDANGGLSDRV